MTTYSDPLEQRFEAKIRDLSQRLAAAEQQLTSMTGRQLIARQVLAAPASTVTIPAGGATIPQTFTNLHLVIAARSDGTGASGYDNASLQFNSVTGANYNWQTWYRTFGGSISSADGISVTAMQCAAVWNAHFASTGRGISTIDIPGYADSTNLKSFTGQSFAADGGAAGVMQEYGGSLGGGHVEPITTLTVIMGGGNFSTGTFSLYAD